MKTKPELQAELIEHLKEMLYLTGWPAGQPETTSKQLMDAISQLQEGEIKPDGFIDEAIREREALYHAYDKIRSLFRGRKWIMEGRGAYPYNDERYKEEVRYIMDEFEEINKDLHTQIKSKSFEYSKNDTLQDKKIRK